MAVLDGIGNVLNKIDKLTTDGVPITLEHKLDTQTVSYAALMAFLVVIGAVLLTGVKDVIVAKVSS